MNNRSFMISPNLTSAILIFVSVVLLLLAYHYQTVSDLHKYISSQYHTFYIPAAISEVLFDHAHDFTSYKYVQGTYLNRIQNGLPFKEALAALSVYDKTSLATVNAGDFPIWNDKGAVLLTLVAFVLFGIKASSIFKMYFVIISVSSIVYIYTYRNSHWRLFLLICLLLSLNISAAAMGEAGKGVGLTEQRALGILGIVPFLHLIVATHWRGSKAVYFAMGFQAVMLVFAYFMRVSALWMVIAVFAYPLTYLIVVRGVNAVRERKGEVRPIKESLTPVLRSPLMVSAALVLLVIYRSSVFNPIYDQNVETGRSVWHNAYMSFAYEPQLKKDMFIKGDYWDHGVISALERYLVRSGREEEWASFRASNQAKSLGLFSVGKWDSYVREMYFDAWKTHPMAMIRLYTYYKPVSWLKTMRPILLKPIRGYRAGEVIPASGVADAELVISEMRQATPLFWVVTFTFFLLAAVVSWRSLARAGSWPVWLGIGVVFVTAQLPWMAAYPWFSVVAESYLMSLGLFYFSISLFASQLTAYVFARLRGA